MIGISAAHCQMAHGIIVARKYSCTSLRKYPGARRVYPFAESGNA